MNLSEETAFFVVLIGGYFVEVKACFVTSEEVNSFFFWQQEVNSFDLLEFRIFNPKINPLHSGFLDEISLLLHWDWLLFCGLMIQSRSTYSHIGNL